MKIKNTSVISTLILIDLLTFASAYGLASYSKDLMYAVSPDAMGPHLTQFHLQFCWWVPGIFLFFLAYERLYFRRLPFWDEAREITKAVTVAIIIILSIVTLGRLSDRISRLTLLLLWAFSLFLFPAFRLAGKKILYKLGLWRENVIILGAGKAGKAVAHAITQDPHLGFNLVGFLDDSADKISTTVKIHNRRYKVFGRVRNYKRFVRVMRISSVIIAIPSLPPNKLTELTNKVQKHTKHVLLIPELKGMSLMNTELHHLFVQQMFLLKINNNLKSLGNRIVKRVSDVVLSLIVLPAIAPLIGIAWLLIRMDSKGPAFFVQDRLGRRGVFKCIKFRTMHINSEKLLEEFLKSNPTASAEWEKFRKIKGEDPRVTRVGKFLRKTSLDELPQLINIIKGDMSLIGPRPYLPEEKKALGENVDTILLINPGLSGLWQVSGRNDLTFNDRVKLDTWYILNWSLWLDLMILFKTVAVVLKRQGAY